MLTAILNVVRTMIKLEPMPDHDVISLEEYGDRSFKVFSKISNSDIAVAVRYLGQVKVPLHGNQILLKGRLLKAAIVAAKRFLALMLWCVTFVVHLFVVSGLPFLSRVAGSNTNRRAECTTHPPPKKKPRVPRVPRDTKLAVQNLNQMNGKSRNYNVI